MSDFKVGDRVKVEFEAEITGQDADGTWMVQPEPYNIDESVYVLPERMTKLGPLLPTKVGSVIDSHGYRFVLTHYGWHATSDKDPCPTADFKNSMYAKDFTVVLEG